MKMRIDLPRAVLAAAILASAVVAAQTVPESVQVKRPDGTVIHPPPAKAPAPDAMETSQAQRAGRAEDLERRREDAQRSTEERLERTQREREGAQQRPSQVR
jgi:hypothetical protein